MRTGVDTPPMQTSNDQQRTAVKEHARDHFEKWALSYDNSRLNELVFFPSIRRCQQEILAWKQARGDTPYRVLDVGCGTGTMLSLVARDPLAETLVGLDYADQMVRRAAEKFSGSEQANKLTAVRGDAEHLPFRDGSFDVLTCCNSFHHYPHQASAIAEFHRVLRPGGIMILIDGFRDNVIGWVIFDVAVATIEQNVHHAPWSEVREMVEAAGFLHLEQKKMGVLAPLLVSIGVRGAA